MPDGLMDFIVNWGPTLLFIIIVLCAIVLGMIRGFRKSVILFIHMLVVGVLCLCFYLWIVNQKEMDAILVKQADTVLGWMGQSVHQLLDVEAKPTLTEMLTEKNFGIVIGRRKGYHFDSRKYGLHTDIGGSVLPAVFIHCQSYCLCSFDFFIVFDLFHRLSGSSEDSQSESPISKRRNQSSLS